MIQAWIEKIETLRNRWWIRSSERDVLERVLSLLHEKQHNEVCDAALKRNERIEAWHDVLTTQRWILERLKILEDMHSRKKD